MPKTFWAQSAHQGPFRVFEMALDPVETIDEEFETDDGLSDGLDDVGDESAESDAEDSLPVDVAEEGSIWVDSQSLLGAGIVFVRWANSWKTVPDVAGGWDRARDLASKIFDVVRDSLVEHQNLDAVAKKIKLPPVPEDSELKPTDLAMRRMHNVCRDLAQNKRQRAQASGAKVKRTLAEIKADAALLR